MNHNLRGYFGFQLVLLRRMVLVVQTDYAPSCFDVIDSRVWLSFAFVTLKFGWHPDLFASPYHFAS